MGYKLNPDAGQVESEKVRPCPVSHLLTSKFPLPLFSSPHLIFYNGCPLGPAAQPHSSRRQSRATQRTPKNNRALLWLTRSITTMSRRVTMPRIFFHAEYTVCIFPWTLLCFPVMIHIHAPCTDHDHDAVR